MWLRIVGAIACVMAALDCANFATGTVSQHVFSDQMLWFWWVIALGWATNAVWFLIDALTDEG